MKKWIYILTDPRTRRVCYVGATMDPKKRLSSHIAAARGGKNSPVVIWIRELLCLGLKPIFFEVAKVDDWNTEERRWIQHYSRCGETLLNVNSKLVQPRLRPTISLPSLLKVSEAAKKLNIHQDTLREWIYASKVPAYRLGTRWRLKIEDVEALLQKRQQQEA